MVGQKGALGKRISRRRFTQWGVISLLAQTAVSEDETLVDAGTDVARVSLLKYIEVDPEAVNSAFWSVFVPIDNDAPSKEPYPIMFFVSVAILSTSLRQSRTHSGTRSMLIPLGLSTSTRVCRSGKEGTSAATSATARGHLALVTGMVCQRS